MAANSTREQIILATVELCRTIPGIKTNSLVRTLQAHSDLQEFANTQFPVCAIVGRLPVPDGKPSGRGPRIDQVRYSLTIDCLIYLQVNQNMDSLISSVADDLVRILWTDQTRGGLVIETLVELKDKLSIWRPFAAFQATVTHKYIKGIGGI